MIENIPPRPSWLKRKPTKTTEAAERAAHKFNVNPADVLALMPEALSLIRREVADRERAKARARQLTGLDARLIASRENGWRDHSTACRFDETSREVAQEFPELGFDPDGHDTPALVWDFIAEGKRPIPCRHSDCVAELAAQWCEQIETEDYPDDADGFDPSEFDDTPACDAPTPASNIHLETSCSQSTFTLQPVATSRQSMDNGTTAASSCPTTGYSADCRHASNSPPSITHSTRDCRNGTRKSCPRAISGGTSGGSRASTSGGTVASGQLSPKWSQSSTSRSDSTPASNIQPKGGTATNDTASRHVCLSSPWSRSPRRNRRRRATARPIPGTFTMPRLRPSSVAGAMVSPGDSRFNSCGGMSATRLGRVAGLDASRRSRDGPLMMRYPASVV